MQKGKLEIICGSMFSGKTKELIERANNAIKLGEKVIGFKPKIDNRYQSNQIVSHNKNSFDCVIIKQASDMINMSKAHEVIIIDEIQFFDSSVINVCLELINDGKRVIGAGLDMDYEGNPFGSVPQLLAIADDIKKLRAKCICGNPANISYRLISEKKQILIGEKNEYEPRCRNCIN